MPSSLQVSLFQFHKVRLKVDITNFSFVSSMFQFHKVRLKEPQAERGAMSLVMFQFHKVRLKGSLEL